MDSNKIKELEERIKVLEIENGAIMDKVVLLAEKLSTVTGLINKFLDKLGM
jgi:hypothetical protein